MVVSLSSLPTRIDEGMFLRTKVRAPTETSTRFSRSRALDTARPPCISTAFSIAPTLRGQIINRPEPGHEEVSAGAHADKAWQT
jgi:hypothetical protein